MPRGGRRGLTAAWSDEARLVNWTRFSPWFDDCWIYEGGLFDTGYGIISVNGLPCGAHCLAYECWRGPIPTGMLVCHSCDVRACVNPFHLFLGTIGANHADMVRKNRHAKGINHGCAVLDEAAVRKIYVDPRKQRLIAREFGIDQTTVSLIKTRKIWRHLGL